jgi:hypothetical protein
MKINLFESFAKSVESLPDKGILKAIDLERQMLKEDLLCRRVEERDLVTIFSFCEFIKAVGVGETITPVKLSPNYRKDCRTIAMRLISAGELPPNTQEQFDLAFPTNAQEYSL